MGSRILNVPYKTQWEPDANQKKTDCGPCCVAMILAGMGRPVATNDVVNAAGGMSGDSGLLQWEVAAKAAAFGLDMTTGSGFSLDNLKSFIDNGQPFIALVKYANLPDRVDKNSVNGHYVVVVGYDDARGVVFINDPDYFSGTTDGSQKAYTYATWLSAWRGDNATDQTYNCSAIVPTKQNIVSGTGVATQPIDQPTRDVFVIAPLGLQLRAQPSVSVGAPNGALFGQHLTAVGDESAVDARGFTWQKVRTDAGVIAFVAASLNGERYLTDAKPADPFTATVLDVPAVRNANGLAIRDQPNPALNALCRVQPGERLTIYRRLESNGLAWLWAKAPNGTIGYARESDAGQVFVSQDVPSVIDTSNSGAMSGEIWVSVPDGLIVRQQPDRSAPPVDANQLGVGLGAHLTIIGPSKAVANDVWQQIKTDDGRQGWVAVKINGQDSVTPLKSTGEVWISAAGGLFLRPKPDKNSGTVVKDPLPKDTHLNVLGARQGPDALGLIWQPVKTDDGRRGWIAVMSGSESFVSTTAPVVAAPTSVVPWGKCLAGLGMGNPQPLTPVERAVIAKSKVEAFKLLTLPDPGENKTLINQLRAIKPDMFIMARLFFSVDANARTRFSPQDFVNFVSNGFEACYEMGVRYFEIHNEPNLPNEGDTWNWTGGAEFGAWLIQVLALLRQRHSDLQLGYPGLSPNDMMRTFAEGSAAAINQCDWIAAHSYWQHPTQPPFPMNAENSGLKWRVFRNLFPNKLIMVTEFSNNRTQFNGVPTTEADKGNQYVQYYKLLRQEPNLGAAFAFALTWPGQDDNREGWVFKNGETQIPGIVGAAIQAGL